MSEIKRLTLISDPTDEFPKNTNNSFKVRLPEPLSLQGEGWYASLMSLTVPDEGQSNAVIASDPHTKVVRYKHPISTRKWTDTGDPSTSGYASINTALSTKMIELEEIMNATQIVSTGSQFWKRVMQTLHNKIMTEVMKDQWNASVAERDRKPIVFVNKHGMPQLSWKGESLVIEAIAKKELLNMAQVSMVEFYINVDIALKFGLLRRKTGKTGYATSDFVLGPNLQYSLPTKTYDESTGPVGSRYRTYYNWEGDVYEGVNFIGSAFSIMTADNVKWLRLFPAFEWQLHNLDASFEKIVGTRKRTVMVYSDLVESTVVGSGKYPLLREVQLLRTGDGESTAEPLHHQWIKLRGQQLDIVEVEIASTAGPLTILPPGKTIVTIGLKQLQKPPRTLRRVSSS